MTEEEIPSFNAQLRSLRKGESLVKAERFEIGEETPDPTSALARMRSVINAAVSRVRKSGSNFRVESVATLTADNAAILAVVAVTRI